jgi:hypothetical protein
MSHWFHRRKLKGWKLHSFTDTAIPVRNVRQRGVRWNGKQGRISVGKELIFDLLDCTTKPDSSLYHGMFTPEYQ